MPTSLAQGTWTRIRVSVPAPAALTEAEPAALPRAARGARVLIPHHAALRTAVSVLRAASLQLARLEPVHAPVLGRVMAATDELATALNAAFDRPAGAAIGDREALATAVHDHHARFGAALLRLRALAAEVRAAAGLTHDTMLIFAAMATVARLFGRHRGLACWVLLTPTPAARAAHGARRRAA
jgi:hypothetical protein